MQLVGSYEVLRVLARGGMAVVYLARQPTLDRDVALKRLHLDTSDPTVAQRFVREARLAAGLDHPNVVTLYDFFEDDGVAYIAMEYVSGGSLRRLVGRLDLPQVFAVLEGILAGLAHAESHGIAHRDLKPENVLVTRGGTVKIADFGIARAYTALTSSLTADSTAIGTPSYMAPEQAQNAPLGPYTDIYAVGVIAYELLAGRPPFEPDGAPLAVLYCHVHTPPPPLAEIAPHVPAPVCRWVEWLLTKAPSDRPASAAEAWQALEELAVADLGPYWRRSAAVTPASTPAPTLVVPPKEEQVPPRTPTTKVVRRHPRARASLAAAAIAAVGAAGVAGYLLLDSDPRDAGRGGATKVPEPAEPYDFDGDGRQELVLGMPGSGGDHSGAVVIRGRGGVDKTITAADAEIPGPYDEHVDFGSSVAGGDFDRDGFADLAVSAPGRDVVSILHGAPDAPLGGRVKPIRTSELRMTPGHGRYGSRLLAADFNADGFDDLLIGAPATDPTETGSGAMQLMLGGPRGVSSETARLLRRPKDALAGFGTKLRVGDLDADGDLDLVEGSQDTPRQRGHATVCRGTARGPSRCRVLSESGTSSLAVADVDHDGFDDILQGDGVADGSSADGGEVRLWRGSRRGASSEPVVISQGSSGVPGDDAPGDLFGTTVDAGDLDGDGYDDIVVAAPGDESGRGAVTIIQGGRQGYAAGGNTRFRTGDGLPGAADAGTEVGGTVAVADVSGDERLDVVVAAEGADSLGDAVYVIEGGRGVFAPGERDVQRPLAGGPSVPDPAIDRIRLARTERR
jgi:predicted Ser/Thr protein kinase